MKQCTFVLFFVFVNINFAIAGEFNIPNSFTAGTSAKASEVNDNFGAAKIAVDDNNASILVNEGEISSNDSDIADLENRAWGRSGKNLFYDSGKVGVGTNDPLTPLHVKDSSTTIDPSILIENTSSSLTSPRVVFVDTLLGSVDAAPTWGIDNVSDRFRIFRQPTYNTAGVEYMSVLNTGNIGIGTTNPQAKLDIAGNIKFTGQKVCHAIISGNWRNTILVPSSWSASTCSDYMTATGTNTYVLGCTFEDSFSMGATNGGIPSPNCGW